MTNITNIREYLLNRDVDTLVDHVWVNDELCTCTFPLWNLSGQLVGYQHHNPNGPKGNRASNKHLDVRELKYQSRITRIDRKDELAVFGLESYQSEYPYLFVVEGIFDCIKLHRLGLPAIAVLSANPKHLKRWLKMLPQRIIVICDRDENGAGNKLRSYGDFDFTVPAPWGDLGDMDGKDVARFVLHLDLT